MKRFIAGFEGMWVLLNANGGVVAAFESEVDADEWRMCQEDCFGKVYDLVYSTGKVTNWMFSEN